MKIAITGGTGFVARHLAPRRLTDEQIRQGLPEAGRFGRRDLRWCSE